MRADQPRTRPARRGRSPCRAAHAWPPARRRARSPPARYGRRPRPAGRRTAPRLGRCLGQPDPPGLVHPPHPRRPRHRGAGRARVVVASATASIRCPEGKRSAGVRSRRCGRSVLYSTTQLQRGLRLADRRPSRSCWSKNSRRIVLCSRSTFPVVVGEYGAVSRMGDAVLDADPVEQHLRRHREARVEPAGEHLAVVGEDLLRNPMHAQRRPSASHTDPRSPAHARAPPRTSSGRRYRSPPSPGTRLRDRSRPSRPSATAPSPGRVPPPVVRPLPPTLMVQQRPVHRRTTSSASAVSSLRS